MGEDTVILGYGPVGNYDDAPVFTLRCAFA